MRKIGFIGGYDKTEFVIYVAKMLTLAGKRVLVIDNTLFQKTKYIVPTINPTISYMTTYEDVDIAIGFSSLEDVARYIGKSSSSQLGYDFVLIDTDLNSAIESMNLDVDVYKNFFVTSMDLYSIRKGLEAIQNMRQPMKLERIVFTREIMEEEDQYIKYLSSGYQVQWDNNILYMPLEAGDQSTIIENQKIQKIRFKNLTNQYKEGLIYVTEELLEGINAPSIRKIIKTIEKGE